MDVVFKFFDQMTEKLPPQLLQMVRLGALLFWLVAATIVVFYSWQRGALEAPQTGQDLSMATIREKITREENLKQPPEITIPGLNDLAPENEIPDLPYDGTRARAGRGLAGEDDRLRDPYPTEAPGESPPFLGDTQSPATDQVFPRNTYKPGRDAGVGGVREGVEARPAPGGEIPVFSQDPAEKPPAPVQPLRRNSEATPDEANPSTGPRQPGDSSAPRANPAPADAPVRAPAPAPGPADSAGSGSGLDLLPVD